MSSRWRTTLRLARRLIRRAPARSVLITALVALPVVAGVFVSVTVSTDRLSPEQKAERAMGRADGIAVVTNYAAVDAQSAVHGDNTSYGTRNGTERDATGYDLAAQLPAGAHAVPDGWTRELRVTIGARTTNAVGMLLDVGDPLTRGIMTVVAGRAPTGAGEAAVTQPLARRLHLHLGSTAVLDTNHAVSVTALLRDTSALSNQAVVAGDVDVFGGRSAFASPGTTLTWLVSLPSAARVDNATLHDRLAGQGVIWASRHDWEQPAPGATTKTDPQVVAVLGAVVFFGLLEVVLLAGTAFAVGARRQVHELALVRVAGGDDRDVRRVILAQGLLLGFAGAAVGTVLGVACVFFGRPVLERVVDRALGPLDVRLLQVAGVVVLGVVASTLAAVVPARAGARLPVVAMLRRRFPVDTAAPRTPLWARLALLVGPVVTAAAALSWHHARVAHAHAFARWLRLAADTANVRPSPPAPRDSLFAFALALGGALTLAGLVRACSELLARAGNAAARAPLSLRLALRDGARHRHRTAPATAAVMTVLAGAVLLVFVISSSEVHQRQEYTPSLPVGDVVIEGGSAAAPGANGTAQAPQAVQRATSAAARLLGTNRTGLLGRVEIAAPSGHSEDSGSVQVQVQCDRTAPTGAATAASCDVGQVAVGDAHSADIVAGRHVPGAAQALAAGRVVVFAPATVTATTTTITTQPPPSPDGNSGEPRDERLPALFVRAPHYVMFPEAIVSAATAAAHGWSVASTQGVIVPTHVPSSAQEDAVTHALGVDAGVYVERGFHHRYGIVLLALIGAAGLVTVAGTSIAVALSMSESRPEMATLAAVGASPSRRRRQAMAQAATVGVLGSVLGLALGSMLGIGLMGGSTSYPFTIPVRSLLLVTAAAPALATVVAGLVTRSRLPLGRRVA